MAQSFASLNVHLVFSTKGREPWLQPAIASRIQEYIGGTLRNTDCSMLIPGGMPDHIHLLVSMPRDRSVSDIVRIVKSNSSRWIHDTFAELSAFSWQTGYGVFSVSYSMIDRVKEYIRNQAVHHRDRSYQDEFRSLLRAHEIEWDEQYVWD